MEVDLRIFIYKQALFCHDLFGIGVYVQTSTGGRSSSSLVVHEGSGDGAQHLLDTPPPRRRDYSEIVHRSKLPSFFGKCDKRVALVGSFAHAGNRFLSASPCGFGPASKHVYYPRSPISTSRTPVSVHGMALLPFHDDPLYPHLKSGVLWWIA